MHTHTAECLGGNELEELTCIELGNDTRRLLNARRHTVTFADDGELHVFTDTKDDAIDLASIENEGRPIVRVQRATAAEERANMKRANLVV